MGLCQPHRLLDLEMTKNVYVCHAYDLEKKVKGDGRIIYTIHHHISQDKAFQSLFTCPLPVHSKAPLSRKRRGVFYLL